MRGRRSTLLLARSLAERKVITLFKQRARLGPCQVAALSGSVFVEPQPFDIDMAGATTAALAAAAAVSAANERASERTSEQSWWFRLGPWQ